MSIQKIKVCLISLLSILLSYSADGQLYDDCFSAEIMCDLNDFANDRYTLPTGGTALECRGTNFANPLFLPFVAGPGDITFSALATSCTPGSGDTGLIMGIWEQCPGFVTQDCIALTECFFYPFGLGNIPRELIVDDLTLEDGQLYYFVISGCEGAECDFTMEVDANSLEVPELDDSEINFITSECTDNNLPQYTYCQGATVNFIAENDIFNSLKGEWYWSIEELSSDADADRVEWFGNARRGVGNPVSNGDFLFRLYGDNEMNFTFNSPGTYNICVDEFRSICIREEGPLCQEVTIIPPPPVQEIGFYNLCYRNVEFQGWDGPDLPNTLGQEWLGGNLELADILSSPQDRDDYYIVERSIPTNDCGCSYTQILYINLVGDEPPGEAELFLSQCQLPYEWFDLTFFSIDDFQGQELVLVGGANEADYTGMKCDSFVVIDVTEIEIPDTIVFSGCANMEYLYTFEIDDIEVEIDNDEEEISFSGLRYQWIDSITGISLTPLTDNPTTALADGTYYVSVTGFMDDVNHNDNSVNTSPNSFVNCLFGPYQVDNPEIPTPILRPYDNTICSNDISMQQYEISNSDPLINYNWLLPNNLIGEASYNIDNTILTINDISDIGNQSIGVYASSDCGISDTLFFSVNILQPIPINNFSKIEACINSPIRINYNSNNGDLYNWSIPEATITGNPTDGSPFDISYNTIGLYNYSYIVSDVNGCTAESPLYEIEIYQAPEETTISCLENLDPGNITFEWEVIPSLTYEIVVINPNNIQGTVNNNQIIFENLPPLTEIEIAVTATGPGPSGCNSSTSTFTCVTDDCDLSTPDRNNFTNLVLCQDNTSGNIQFDIESIPGIQGEYIGQAVSIDGLLDLGDPIFDTPGLYSISYIYTDDAMTCIEEIEIIIEVVPEITIEGIVLDDICTGDDTVLSPTISGSSSNYTYLWEPDGSVGNSLTIPENIDAAPGSYEVTLTVTDIENICQSVQTFSYNVIEPIEDVLLFNSAITCNELPGEYPNFIDFTSIQNTDGTWYDNNDIELTNPNNINFDGFPEAEYGFYFVPNPNTNPCLEDRYDFIISVEDCGCPDIVLDIPQNICSPISGSDNYVLSSSITGVWTADSPNISILNNNQLIVDANSISGDYNINFSIDDPVVSCITDTMLIITIEQLASVELQQDISACHIDTGSGSSVIDLDDIILSGTTGVWSSLNNEFIINSNNEVDFDGADIQSYTFFYNIEATNLCPAVSYPVEIRVRDCSCPDFAITSLPQLCTTDPILSLEDYLVNPENLDGEWIIDGQTSDGQINPLLYSTGSYEIQYIIENPIGGNCDSIAVNTIDIYESIALMLSSTEMTFCNSPDNMEYPFFIDLLDLSNNATGQWEAPLNYNGGIITDTSTVSFDNVDPDIYVFTFTPFQNPNSPCGLVPLSFTAEVIDCSCDILILQDTTLCSDASNLFDLNELIITSDGMGSWSLESGPSIVDITQGQFVDVSELDGVYNFDYTLTDINPGCDNSASALLTVTEQYDPITLSRIIACNRISESNDYTFDLSSLISLPGEWSAPTSFTNNFDNAAEVSFLDQAIGIYTFTYVTEPNGVCTPITISQDIEVIQCCDDAQYIIESESTCPGQSNGSISVLIQNSTSAYNYSIDGGLTYVEESTFNNLATGTYSVVVQDEDLCETQLEDVNVEEYTLLDISLGSDIRIVASDSLYSLSINPNINPNEIESISWFQDDELLCQGSYDDCATLEVDVVGSSIICIEVSDINGCENSDCISIDEVIPQRIFIPNTFSPTSIDNKYFYIGADEFIESIIEFKIYGRWGELLFDAADNYEVNIPDQGWDGTYNGELISQGVYVYLIKARFVGDQKDEIYTGTITLLR